MESKCPSHQPVLRIVALILLSLVPHLAITRAAEEAAEPSERSLAVDLGEETVTTRMPPETLWALPEKIETMSDLDLRERKQARTLPESFKELPGIMVQKTSHGQGSPFIRGFTGYHTLLLIDGIRLNNSVFRSGPNQYWNTVDPLSISSIDIVQGAGGVLYGSDAIGGAVNVLTRGAPRYGPGFQPGGAAYYRYASAEDSHVGRLEGSAGYGNRLGFYGGVSGRDFGELEAGRDVGVQRETGYEDWDADGKVEYFLKPDQKVVFAFQRVQLDNAWRTHKTIHGVSWEGTAVGTERKRILDQARELLYLQYHGRAVGGFLDAFSASLSFQRQEEDRHRIRSDGRQDRQGFDVETLGAWIRAETESPLGTLTYGGEYYLDWVDSYRKDFNADGSLRGVAVQGPVADNSRYHLFGLFLQDRIPIIHDRLDVIAGGRYTFARADADSVADPVSGDEMSLSDHWDSLVGSGQVVYHVDDEDHWTVVAGVSQGFRTPNLSDLTRLDTARSNEIETPSPGLDPEEYLSFEVGVNADYQTVAGQISYFYYDIEDMIVRTPTGAVIDTNNEVIKKNAGDGYLHGVEIGGRWQFWRTLSAFGTFTWLDGEVDTYPTSAPVKKAEPISRLMPTTTNLGLRWDDADRKFWVEGLVTIAGEQNDLSTRDEADTQRIPPGGTPRYAVLTVRGAWKVIDRVTVSAAIENVTNEDYRIHGSGLNEPGTNAVLSVRWDF